MAKRAVAGGAGKGSARPGRRSIIAVILVGFVLVTVSVVLRRVIGVERQNGIRKLQQQRDALEAERIRVESGIREASSRERLQPIAERNLDMHIPTPDQQVLLSRSTSDSSPRRAPHDSL